ncbi:hypothetical protein [Terrabacter sp. NPDC000476]|uniref:hypothetical protein n=1 Tax=Terrabacter sp. NPDC000476 TaxID=3154258 RepID=UPI003330FB3C
MTATTTATPANLAPPAAAPGLPSRALLVARVRAVLDASGLRWAWQGESGAVDGWAAATDAKDLDVWVEDAGARTRAVQAVLDVEFGARIAHADDPARLRHTVWAAETTDGLAVVDLTVGDLSVGAVRLLAGDDVLVSPRPGPHGPVLGGAARVADLVVRRLLRGGAPSPARLEEARIALRDSDAHETTLVRALLERTLGRTAGPVLAALAGADLPASVPARARRRLLSETVRTGLPAAARQWRSVVPSGPLAGPAGLRRRGTVVVLVGTDGSGKSTIAAELTQRLERAGLPTASAYFGMAHGNLPGVVLARRLLGVAPAGDRAGTPQSTSPSTKPGGLDHATVRRAAAWFYAAEYVWRWSTAVAPHLVRGRVVVVDRWVWDLRESPWPGSRASAWLERAVPRPDVVALGDAPAALIHARKPERSEAEQARQQAHFHGILAGRPARCAEVVVDTSGASADACGPLVAAVVAAAHTRPRQDGVPRG